MILATVTVQARVTDSESILSGDDLEQFCDRLMEALLKLEELDPVITDPSVAASLALGEIEVELSVEADLAEDAMYKAFGSIRSAVHEIGGSTPGWELDVIHADLRREDEQVSTTA